MMTYGPAVMPKTGGKVSSVVVTTGEATVISVTDPRYLEKSQLSAFINGTVGTSGGNAKIYIRHYFSFDGGSTWYQVPVINLSTGELLNLPDMIDSGSPGSLVRDLPISGANAYKMTAQADTGTATITSATVMFRDN